MSRRRQENPPVLDRAIWEGVRRVRLALERHLDSCGRCLEGPSPEVLVPDDGAGPTSRESPLEVIQRTFGLSPFESDVLLLCAGVDVCAEVESLVAQASEAGAPTFGLARALFEGAHWSAFSPASPLRYWRLIELADGVSLMRTPLRIDERVLHFILGVECGDERLRGVTSPERPPRGLPSLRTTLARRIARQLAAWGSHGGVARLQGESSLDTRSVAASACASLDFALHALTTSAIPASGAERETLARLLDREAVFTRTLPLIDLHGAETSEAARALEFVEQLQAPTILCGRILGSAPGRPSMSARVPACSESEREEVLRGALGEFAEGLNGAVASVAWQFRLGAMELLDVGESVRLGAAGDASGSSVGSALWRECRRRSRGQLDALAQRIETRATWDDLVLPEEALGVLREVAAHVRHRRLVHDAWGFGSGNTRGLGVSALFVGPSGTGKTMAAEVLAGALDLDLFRVDLSALVSKYIGETEKNLRRVFDAADNGGAILLFDEADALFGKRSEVRDSHDRYANIEVSYLLQRMETYRGLAVLTSNFKSALDPAFHRRLRFVVHFPFPDASLRERLWRRSFPPRTPVDQLDFIKLARLNVSGGSIRNMALRAAFLAAESGGPVRMAHLLEAARGECAKADRAPSGTEVGDW